MIIVSVSEKEGGKRGEKGSLAPSNLTPSLPRNSLPQRAIVEKFEKKGRIEKRKKRGEGKGGAAACNSAFIFFLEMVAYVPEGEEGHRPFTHLFDLHNGDGWKGRKSYRGKGGGKAGSSNATCIFRIIQRPCRNSHKKKGRSRGKKRKETANPYQLAFGSTIYRC